MGETTEGQDKVVVSIGSNKHKLSIKYVVIVLCLIIVLLLIWLVYFHEVIKPSDDKNSFKTFNSKIIKYQLTNNSSSANSLLNWYIKTGPPTLDRQFALVQVGNIYASKNEYSKSITYYKEANSLSSNKQLYIVQALAQSYYETGQKTQAIYYYKLAISLLNLKEIGAVGEKIAYTQKIAELSK